MTLDEPSTDAEATPTGATELPEGPSSFDEMLGVHVEQAEPDQVVLRLRVMPHHLQPAGLVHGGVYATLAETAASIGASLSAMARRPQDMAVGLENHTTFLRRAGLGAELVATAIPEHAGRRTQAWRVTMVDVASGREVAASSVRLLVVDRNEPIR